MMFAQPKPAGTTLAVFHPRMMFARFTIAVLATLTVGCAASDVGSWSPPDGAATGAGGTFTTGSAGSGPGTGGTTGAAGTTGAGNTTGAAGTTGTGGSGPADGGAAGSS